MNLSLRKKSKSFSVLTLALATLLQAPQARSEECPPPIALPATFKKCTDAQNAAPFAGGNGSLDNPYLICNLFQLDRVRSPTFSSKHFKLLGDIDATVTYPSHPGNANSKWHNIGFVPIPALYGSFSGAGHKIYNLYIDRRGGSYLSGLASGLFSRLSSNLDSMNGPATNTKGSVDNLHLRRICYFGGSEMGAIAAISYNGLISNSSATGQIHFRKLLPPSISSGSGIGGLVGVQRYQAKVMNSYSAVTISAETDRESLRKFFVGGLIGESHGSQVESSYSTQSINTVSSNEHLIFGGLVGYLGGYTPSTIEKSFSTSVSNWSGFGALVGLSRGRHSAVINSVHGYSSNPHPQPCFFETDGANGTCSTVRAVNLDLNPAFFFGAPVTVPRNQWDYTHTWLALPGRFPVLRISGM